MTSHAAAELLMKAGGEAADNSTVLDADFSAADETIGNLTTAIPAIVNSTISSTTEAVLSTTLPTSTTPSPLSTTRPPPADSHFLFAFCTVLFFVAIALIVKVVYSHRKKYRNLAPNLPSWRLSASRSSAGFTSNGFAAQNAAGRSGRASSGTFGSAHYTAVPPSTSARLANQQQHDAFMGDRTAQLEWERQFFDDDAANEQENRTGSRLELRR